MVSQRPRQMEIKRRHSQIRNNLKNPLDIIENLWYNKYRKTKKGIDTMDKGLTIKQGFARALEDYRKIGDAEMIAFFEKRLEQANKKATTERKLTPHQQENEKIKEGILDNMETAVRYTIADMLVTFDCFPETMTPQRLSALLSQLGSRGSNQIIRTEEKGKAYFSLA